MYLCNRILYLQLCEQGSREFDIRKRILTLVFGYLKCGSFRNPVRNNAAIDVTGMSVPIRLISSEMLEMGLGYCIYGVESLLPVLLG